MTKVTMDDLRQMARDMSGVNKWGVAVVLRNGLPWCEEQYSEQLAVNAIAGATRFAVALNGVVIAQSDTPTPTTHNPAESRELAPLAALSDADLHERTEAAWSMLMTYLNEKRRRAGLALESEEIPF